LHKRTCQENLFAQEPLTSTTIVLLQFEFQSKVINVQLWLIELTAQDFLNKMSKIGWLLI